MKETIIYNALGFIWALIIVTQDADPIRALLYSFTAILICGLCAVSLNSLKLSRELLDDCKALLEETP